MIFTRVISENITDEKLIEARYGSLKLKLHIVNGEIINPIKVWDHVFKEWKEYELDLSTIQVCKAIDAINNDPLFARDYLIKDKT